MLALGQATKTVNTQEAMNSGRRKRIDIIPISCATFPLNAYINP